MSGHAGYGSYVDDRRSFLRVAFWFVMFVTLTFMFAYAWRLYVGPYNDFYLQRLEEHEQASIYLRTEVCENSDTRSKLEGHNLCGQSKRTLARSPQVAAFYDLMDWLSFCRDGICRVFGINIGEWMLTSWKLIGTICALLYIASAFGFVTSQYGRASVAYSLPIMISPEQQQQQHAAFMAQHAAANKNLSMKS